MGYADTIPFVSIKSNTSTLGSSFITITNAAGDKAINSVETLDYHVPISDAYMYLHVPYTKDTSGAENYHNQAGGGYIELDDGVSTKNCGYVYNYHLMTPANGYGWNHHIQLYTNLASYLNPNTTYTATWKNAQAVGNNLLAYWVRPVIEMYYVK